MKNKKKSFYFEDYAESELYNENEISGNIKISLNRVSFLFFIFVSLILIFTIKLTYLSLSPDKNIYTNIVKKNILQNRRNIVDREGSILATNVNLYDVGVRPKLLNELEKKNLIIKLKLLFPQKNLNKFKLNLNKNKFFW